MAESFESLVALNRDLGMNADVAFTTAARQNPESYQQYMRAAREPKAPVEKTVAKPPPDHCAITEIKKRVALLQQQQPGLSHTDAFSKVLATPEGQVLTKAYYNDNPQLRRQGVTR